MATRILGMGDIVGLVDRAQTEIDEDEQARMEAKLQAGKFDLDDFLKQLGAIKKMGSLRDLLGHIPGIGGQVDQLDLQGNELQSVESIIQSMTSKERERPEILNTSRRKRIAVGCGRSIGEVNDLLKQFKQMQAMMQEMTGHGKGIVGKFKAARAMKKQLGGESVDSIMKTMGGGPEGAGGGGLGAMFGGEQPASRPARERPKVKDVRKKRKAERKRRRKSRRR